ncbi:dihydropteroate synthase [Granulicella tundricola]|nr:dihydropteroate synthase [Granulicella tundricola]
MPLGKRTVLMGIVNVTPDSFSDGGMLGSVAQVVDHALWLLDEGADLVDVGGESTRPGAIALHTDQEQARVLPVLEAILKARPEAIVSVDTYHAATARRAAEAGAEIINDVSGLMWDPEMAAVMEETQVGVVLMHARGRPQEWAGLPPLADAEILPLVLTGLRESVRAAETAGVRTERIVIDPGFGFGKHGAENFVLHAGLERLGEIALPMLVGTSRKRFLSAEVENRAAGTLASGVAAVLSGAHILRVHEVRAMRAATEVADGILRSNH